MRFPWENKRFVRTKSVVITWHDLDRLGEPTEMTRDEMRVWARDVLSDPEYLASFRKRLLAGELPPKLEALMYRLAMETISASKTESLELPRKPEA